jgi:hypothetical protein
MVAGQKPHRSKKEENSMPKQSEDNDLYPKASVALYRTRDLLFRCEDRAVGKFGLTAEQYSVLAAIKQLDDPVRPTDVGRLLDHKVNTVSMIVDRMVNAGLVDRVRDLARPQRGSSDHRPQGREGLQAGTYGSHEAQQVKCWRRCRRMRSRP